MDLSLQLSSVLAELALCHTATADTSRRAAAFATAARQPVPEAEQPALCRAFSSAGSQMAQLGGQLIAALQGAAVLGSLQSEGRAVVATCTRFLIACQVVRTGAQLCTALGGAAPTSAFQQSVVLLLGCGRELLAVVAAMEAPLDGSNEPVAVLVWEVLSQQLQAMLELWQLGAASLADVAPPDAFVSWLGCAVGAVRTLNAPLLDKGKAPPADCLSPLLGLSILFLDEARKVDAYRDALRHDATLPASLLAAAEPGLPTAAVALALPAEQRPPGLSWQLAGRLAAVMGCGELSDALEARLMTGGGSRSSTSRSGAPRGASTSSSATSASGGVTTTAQRLLSSVVRLLELAAQERGEEAETELEQKAVLVSACSHLHSATAEQQSSGTWRCGEGHMRLMRTLRKALVQMPHALRLSWGSPLIWLPLGLGQQQPQCPAEPSLAEQGLRGAGLSDAWTCVPLLLHTICLGRGSTQGSQQQPALVGSLADVEEWCAAAAGALCALPQVETMAELVQRPGAQADVLPGLMGAPGRLATQIATVADDAAVLTTHGGKTALLRANGQALWAAWAAATQLHAALCRCTHWLAGGAAQHLPDLEAKRLDVLIWVADAARGARAYGMAWDRAAPADDPARELITRQAQAVGAATWEAVQVLAAGHQGALLRQPTHCAVLIRALATAAELGPATVGGHPELLRSLQEALPCLPQGQPRERACSAVLHAAARSPHLAVSLLAAGLLESVVQGSQAAAPVRAPAGAPDFSLFAAASTLIGALNTLCKEGQAVGAGDSGTNTDSGSQGSGGAAGGAAAGAVAGADSQACRQWVGQAAAVLSTAVDRFTDTAPYHAQASLRLEELLRRLLPPASALAAALQEWWALPEQTAAARLEAAQAAAARSCANLRCPNLGLEGGAAAGQGVGCKRCSLCRTACYCGE
ncbi:hypothetical protein ABPG75_002806 [Micractinium tetrahymenae]